jgi:hypothetical protein
VLTNAANHSGRQRRPTLGRKRLPLKMLNEQFAVMSMALHLCGCREGVPHGFAVMADSLRISVGRSLPTEPPTSSLFPLYKNARVSRENLRRKASSGAPIPWHECRTGERRAARWCASLGRTRRHQKYRFRRDLWRRWVSRCRLASGILDCTWDIQGTRRQQIWWRFRHGFNWRKHGTDPL